MQLGISVFPVNYRNKTPKLKWEQYQKILSSQTEIKRWFNGGSLHNYGIVAGWQNLVILDFDSMDKYYEWQLWTLNQYSDSPANIAATLAFKVKTSRGMHIYLCIPEKLNNFHVEGLDIKAHGYVLGPGSTHPSGSMYTPQTEHIIIPQVPSLNSVLPDQWMEQIRHPAEPTPPHTQYIVGAELDPYDIASNPLDRDSDLIQQIRQRHKLQDYLQNITLTGHGWFMGSCPFHADKNPSFWIDDKRQIGNCQKCVFPKPLDVINLYAKIHQVSDQQAITILAHA
jgi:hypothetical protein